MNIYTWFMNLCTPYLYPWGWAFVIGGAFGVSVNVRRGSPRCK